MQRSGKEDFLTAAEVASLLRISRATIYTYLKRGNLKGRKVGRRRLFTRDEITSFAGFDPFKTRKPPEELSQEVIDARAQLEKLDKLRRERVGDEVLKRVKPIITFIRKASDYRGNANGLYIQG